MIEGITVYQFVYAIVMALGVVDILLLITIYAARLVNLVDKRLFAFYSGQVYQLMGALATGVADELLPVIKKNIWSRRAFLVVCCEEMPRLNQVGKIRLSVILETQGVIDYLIVLLTSVSTAQRLRACYYLGQLHSEKAVPCLKKMIVSREYHLSQAALVALAKIGRNSGISIVLEKLLGDKRYPVERMADIVSVIMQHKPQRLLRMAIETTNIEMKVIAVAALGRSKYEEAFPLFVELLQHSDSEIRVKSAKGLIGSNYQPAIGILIDRLKNDDSWVVKVACARALGSLQAFEAVGALFDALRHTNWWVRTAVVDALITMGTSIIPFIQRQVRIETDTFAHDRLEEILQYFEIGKVIGGGFNGGNMD